MKTIMKIASTGQVATKLLQPDDGLAA